MKAFSILDIVNRDLDEPRTSMDTDRVTLVDKEVEMEIDTSQPYEDDTSHEYSIQDDIIAVKALESLDPTNPPKTEKFLKRVYSIPFLNNTVNSIQNSYESAKNSSGVLKYSAESVESVTMRVTLPVLNTLEPVLTPLDRFACNQLDRVEKRFPFISGYTHPVDANDYYNLEGGNIEQMEIVDNTQERKQSRWPKVVGSVGANLGVLKRETLAALRYCIEVIQYAANAITGQISVLTQAIANSRL